MLKTGRRNRSSTIAMLLDASIVVLMSIAVVTLLRNAKALVDGLVLKVELKWCRIDGGLHLRMLLGIQEHVVGADGLHYIVDIIKIGPIRSG